jgi:aspartyl-tRNA(Asn)/glutamyl-tRNA(Gln) amidotransferase subunit B
LAELVRLIDDNTISGKIAKQIYPAMMNSEGTPAEIVEKKGLKQITDTDSIEPIVDEIIAKNPKAVEDLKAGNQRAIGALVGQIMKATKGQANPQLVNAMIMKKIG